MADFTYNRRIRDKIYDLNDADDEFKEFLDGLVEWEKDNYEEGKNIKFMSEYDKRFLKLAEKIGDV